MVYVYAYEFAVTVGECKARVNRRVSQWNDNREMLS